MQKKIRSFINEVMDHQSDLTLATLRKDGWPQANTVSYAHAGAGVVTVSDADQAVAVARDKLLGAALSRAADGEYVHRESSLIVFLFFP